MMHLCYIRFTVTAASSVVNRPYRPFRRRLASIYVELQRPNLSSSRYCLVPMDVVAFELAISLLSFTLELANCWCKNTY